MNPVSKPIPSSMSGKPEQRSGRSTAGAIAAVLLRVVLAVLGCYVFSWFFAAAGLAALCLAGVDFHDAEKTMMMLAPLVYLGMFLWAFADRSLARVCILIVVGSIILAWVARALENLQLG
ncbi:MAG: iron uptake protein [Pseudomonadota bacterium]|nr:iron uptake protein [Pseudomonadota bacterium]